MKKRIMKNVAKLVVAFSAATVLAAGMASHAKADMHPTGADLQKGIKSSSSFQYKGGMNDLRTGMTGGAFKKGNLKSLNPRDFGKSGFNNKTSKPIAFDTSNDTCVTRSTKAFKQNYQAFTAQGADITVAKHGCGMMIYGTDRYGSSVKAFVTNGDAKPPHSGIGYNKYIKAGNTYYSSASDAGSYGLMNRIKKNVQTQEIKTNYDAGMKFNQRNPKFNGLSF